MPFGILRKQFASSIQMGVLADAGENVQHFPPVRLCVLHAVRGQNRQSIRARKFDKLPIDALLSTKQKPLNFNKNIFAPKSIDQQFSAVRARLGSARVSRVGEGVLAIANFFGRTKYTVSCESFKRLFPRAT